jgi:hypothetical protein
MTDTSDAVNPRLGFLRVQLKGDARMPPVALDHTISESPGPDRSLGDAIPFENKKATEDVACHIVEESALAQEAHLPVGVLMGEWESAQTQADQ